MKEQLIFISFFLVFGSQIYAQQLNLDGIVGTTGYALAGFMGRNQNYSSSEGLSRLMMV